MTDVTAWHYILQTTVNSLNISGNVDNPEGGLDALMQVAVCGKVRDSSNP